MCASQSVKMFFVLNVLKIEVLKLFVSRELSSIVRVFSILGIFILLSEMENVVAIMQLEMMCCFLSVRCVLV